MKYFHLLSFVICSSFIIHSCTYTQKVTDGATAYQLKQYAVAAPMLEKEFKKNKDLKEKGKLAFLAAESYDKMNQSEKALEWYKLAYDNQYGKKALGKYAFHLKKAEMYAEAVNAFVDLGALEGDGRAYLSEINICEKAMQWKKEENDNEYQVEIAGFNSENADYSPTQYEGNKIVISSDRPNSEGDDGYKWTGNAFSDLYIVDTNSDEVSPFDGIINSKYNEGTIAFNSSYDEIIFSRCGTGEDQDDYCKLMISKKTDGGWSEPKILSFVLDQINYAHPVWSSDGKTLFFVSDQESGWGGFDIYTVTRSQSGWGEPKILPSTINTEKDDMFPSFDGDTLYFASEGKAGMGGLDIFKTYQKENNEWLTPENLKAPINSGEDDFGFIVTETHPKTNMQKGYFSSARKGGKGNDDIYAFSKKIPEPEIIPEPIDTPIVVEPDPIPEPKKDIILEVYVYGKTYSNPNDPKSAVNGKTALKNTSLQISSSILNDRVKTDEQGKYSFKIEEKIDYRFFVSHAEYFSKSAVFSTNTQGEKEVYRLEIVLDQIFRNVEIKLDNIYYDYNKWDIREDAKPTLNKLANILLENPNIHIILGSHTDCRGKEKYNQELSQKRAQSAVDYLVTRGITRNRLQATGYGKSAPVTLCECSKCTDEEHQSNRRTTFKIVN